MAAQDVDSVAAVGSAQSVTVNGTASIAQLTNITSSKSSGATLTYTSITDTASNLVDDGGTFVTGDKNIIFLDERIFLS